MSKDVLTGRDKRYLNAGPMQLMEIMNEIARGGGFQNEKVEVADVEKTTTKKIIIPETMSKLEAAHELERQHEEEESIVNLDRTFTNWDYKDILVAIKRATEEHFGWIDAKTVHTFFGPIRPSFIEITTDVKNGVPITEEAFHGQTEVSAWENAKFMIHIASSSAVSVRFELKKKYKSSASGYFDLIGKKLKEASIYRGKSLAIQADGRGGISYEIFENKPSDKIFLNEANELVIEDFVIPDLTEPGKRAYLFTGEFGTGKTETAMRLGDFGNKNAMSFIYLKDSSLLEQVILLSQNYSPCLLFLEDLDEVASGDRSVDINEILNTLDGVQSKKSDLKIIFTTNNEDKINPAFRRPGRIDQIVQFDFPDMQTKKKIATAYLKDFAGFAEIDLDKAVAHYPDAQGAVIAEVTKRIAKLATKYGSVKETHFISASESIRPQLDLMRKDMKLKEATLDSTLSALIRDAVKSYHEE